MSNLEERNSAVEKTDRSINQTLSVVSSKCGVLRPSLLKFQENLPSGEISTHPVRIGFDEIKDCSAKTLAPVHADSNKLIASDKKTDAASNLRICHLPASNFNAGTIPSTSPHNFIFGENIHERVTGERTKKDGEIEDNKSRSPELNDSSNMLFSNALNNVKSSEGNVYDKEVDTKSLTEAARMYEESKAQKRKYEAVETFTGEENEVNVVEVNCKIFAFIKGNWEEHGRGSMRLNDAKDENSSRVVFRTAGNLRLLINTKIWAEMVVQKPSQKSLRITAMDNSGQIKIFLIMARPNDISSLYMALKERVTSCSNGTIENIEKNNIPEDNAPNESDELQNCEPNQKKRTFLNN